MRKGIAIVLMMALLLMVCSIALAESQTASDEFAESVQSALEDPGLTYAIEARWWLAEGTHTDETLIAGVHALYEAGYGAVEFVTLDESDVDDSLYAWGSEEWAHDSALIIEEATKLGMGVSFTSGTNWGTANLPTITPDDEEASQEIDYTAERVSAGESRSGALQLCEVDEGITVQRLIQVSAYRVNPDAVEPEADVYDLSNYPETALTRIASGRHISYTDTDLIYLDFDSYIDLTASVVENEDGTWTLDWTAPDDGDYELLTFWMHGTGHYSEPSVGTNYTIDYISGLGVDALIEYWEANLLTDELVEVIEANGRVQLYMDSLELASSGNGTHYWCSSFLEEFETRRGYDLTPYLPFIMRVNQRTLIYYYSIEGQEALLEKVRTDLYQTLTEMYSENTLGKIQEWLYTMNMTLRCENSYCQTFEITYPMQYIDSVETESFEFMDQIESFRAMSGGVHFYGKVLSSESGANYATFSTSFDRLLNMMYAQFAAGISRTVTHGFSVTAGPESNYTWPGHQSMFAIFSERAPYWRDSVDINTQIARLQKILRDGSACMDVAIMRYDYELFSFHDNAFWDAMIEHYAYYWTDLTLQDAGYTYDYFSPDSLTNTEYAYLNDDATLGLANYQAVILFQEALSYDAAVALNELAKQGLPVVIVTGDTTEYQWGQLFILNEGAATRTPGNDGLDEELAAVMAEMITLDNVMTVETEAEAYDALIAMDIHPRAEFAESNAKLLTVTRDWDDVRFVYVYNYKFDEEDAYEGDIIMDGLYQPYVYDPWTNDITALAEYSINEDGNTVVHVALEPGEIIVFALDALDAEAVYAVSTMADKIVIEDGSFVLYASASGSYETVLSDGTTITTEVSAPDDIALDTWNLSVESWTPGEVITITEDRGLGYITEEYEQLTEKTMIDVGETSLVSWTDIEAVGIEVSGIGYYTTTFVLPDDWDASNCAVFMVDSLGGGTAQVYVNGVKAEAVDITNVELDISDLVNPGENTIEVQVATGLTNYQQSVGAMIFSASGAWTGPYDYGMMGDAVIVTYETAIIE